MVKRIIIWTIALTLIYVGVVNFQIYMEPKIVQPRPSLDVVPSDTHTVYRFSFSKYKTNGDRELEIEGDSADLFSREVKLLNVLAKAYAEETPVVVTADRGAFDKATGVVHLQENVVATTDTGARLLTESLDIFSGEKRLETLAPAEVKRDNVDIAGTGATGDSKLNRVKFKKNVTVSIWDPSREQTKPTIITCDGPLEIDYLKNRARFHDNVVADDEQGILKADEMEVFYDKDTQQVDKIVAKGNVEVQKPDGSLSYSDSLVYYARERRIVLGGDTEALIYQSEDDSDSDPFFLNKKPPAKETEASENDAEGKTLPSSSDGDGQEKEKPTTDSGDSELPTFITEGLV